MSLNYLNIDFGFRSWFLSLDHKRIALLYLLCITAMFSLGCLFAFLLRVELVDSGPGILTADLFNRLFSGHGIVMFFFVLLPLIHSVLGNFLTPMMIGARNLAFPRLNLMGWYLYIAGGFCLVWSFLRGGVDTTWTFVPPYSSVSEGNVLLAAFGVLLAALAILLQSLNFVVTIHKLRSPAVKWSKLSPFVWAEYAASWVLILATPTMLLLMVLILVERVLGIGIFNPEMGGEPFLFKRLFWFFARPSFYAIILPAIGIVTEVISAFTGRQVVGYRYVIASMWAIAVLGCFTAGGHLIASTQSVYTSVFFSAANYIIGLPFLVLVVNWVASLFQASIRLTASMLYALGFVLLMVIGGLSGLILAGAGSNVFLHSTTFVVGHFHYLLAGGVVMAYLSGLHFWWPKIAGRRYSESTARLSAVVLFIGLNLTFLPQFVLGFLGMPRRHFTYPPEFEAFNVLSFAGFTILAVGYLLPAIYLLWAFGFGRATGRNPDGATGLEWLTESPPPVRNF